MSSPSPALTPPGVWLQDSGILGSALPFVITDSQTLNFPRGSGTSPNPLVGNLRLREGEALAEGSHSTWDLARNPGVLGPEHLHVPEG